MYYKEDSVISSHMIGAAPSDGKNHNSVLTGNINSWLEWILDAT